MLDVLKYVDFAAKHFRQVNTLVKKFRIIYTNTTFINNQITCGRILKQLSSSLRHEKVKFPSTLDTTSLHSRRMKSTHF